MKEFSEIFKEIVQKISNEVIVEHQVQNQYFTCNTKWARKGKTLQGFNGSNDLVTSKITNVVNNEMIELEDPLIVSNFLILNDPFDITGTKIATNLEWTKVSNFAVDKTPLTWLLDNFDEQVFGRESSIERIVDFKVFFLDETDIKNYYTADHKKEVIQPMMNLKHEFLEIIRKNRNFKALESDRVKYFSRFGTESSQGFEKNILDANLSGLMTSISLTKFKENCKC